MSMHADPVTPAEKFASHLEQSYGVQLDSVRRQALLAEIEKYGQDEHARLSRIEKPATSEVPESTDTQPGGFKRFMKGKR